METLRLLVKSYRLGFILFETFVKIAEDTNKIEI